MKQNEPQMTPQLQGEIALKLVRHKVMQIEIPAPKNFRRYLGNIAKDIGVDLDTLFAFYEVALLPKIVEEMLGCTVDDIQTTRPVEAQVGT